MIAAIKNFGYIISRLIVLTMMVTSCGLLGNSNNNSTSVGSTAITIDNTGVIPVFSAGSTTTTVYVHNNSDVTISGITYTSTSSNVISPASSSACSSIAAGSVCGLVITTPSLASANSTQGSTIITTNFTVNGQSYSFSNIINYKQLTTVDSGIEIYSTNDISGFSNNQGYATFYLYGSGISMFYTLASLSLSQSGLAIVEGYGGQSFVIASEQVNAIEVSAPTTVTGLSATLNVGSDHLILSNHHSSKKAPLGLSTYNYSYVFAVESPQQAMLQTGMIAYIDTASSTSGSTYVVNSGGTPVTITSVTGGTGVTITDDSCSGNSFAVGKYCQISFTVPSGQVGSSTMTINYQDNTGTTYVTSKGINWYDSLSSANVEFQLQTSISFVTGTSLTESVVVNNIGSLDVTIDSVNAAITSGNGQISSVNSGTCTGTLNGESSCTFSYTVTDSTVEANGQINVSLLGTYYNGVTESITHTGVVTYASLAENPSISVNNLNMEVLGNGWNTQIQNISVANSGNGDATSLSISSLTTPLSIESTTCGSSLNAGDSCIISVELGPESVSVAESGEQVLTVTYSGGSISSATATATIDYLVQAYSLSISMLTAPQSTASGGGSGSASTPFVFSASDSANQSVTLTFTNTGESNLYISNIVDPNSGTYWQLDNVDSTCYNYNSSSSSLAAGESCNIVYDNLTYSLAESNAVSGVVFMENLTMPTFTIVDASIGSITNQVQPNLPSPLSGTTIYANGYMATITNTISVANNDTESETVTISNVLTNATMGYTLVTESTVIGAASTIFTSYSGSSNCTTSLTSGIQTCNLVPDINGNDTESVTYSVNPNTIAFQNYNLNTSFSLSPNSQAATISPTTAATTLNKITWVVQNGTGRLNFTTGTGIVTDSYGNVYIVVSGGSFGDSYFLIKYNSLGQQLWSVSNSSGSLAPNSAGYQVPCSISTDGTSIYVSGTGTGINGQSQVGSADYFVAKYNESGSLVWTIENGVSSRYTISSGVVNDTAGNLYAGGYVNGSLNGAPYPGGGYSYFIVKYNSSGTLQWTAESTVTSNSIIQGMASDASNNTYIAISNGDLIKYNSAGSLIFIESYPSNLSSSNTIYYSVADSGSGMLYFAQFGYDITNTYPEYIIDQLTESGSQVATVESLPSLSTTEVPKNLNSIAADSSNVYIDTLVRDRNSGSYYYYLSNYNSTMLFQWQGAIIAGGSQSIDQYPGLGGGNYIALNNSYIYTVGSTSIGLYGNNLTSFLDYYIAQYNSNGY